MQQYSDFLAQHYGPGPWQFVSDLGAGGERLALRFAAPQGEYVVKCSSPGREEAKVRTDVETPRALARKGFPAPCPQPGLDGSLYYRFGERWLYLYPLLPGAVPQPSDSFFPRLGRLLFWLHAEAPGPATPPSDYRPAALVKEIRSTLPTLEDGPMRRHAQQLLEALPAFDGLPTGLVHSDPYYHNLLDDGETLYLIDWEDAGLATPLLDVAYALAFLTVLIPQDRARFGIPGPAQGATFRSDWAAAFLTAYTQNRPLSDVEWRLLPAAIRLSHLLYLHDWQTQRVIPENYQRMLLVDWDAFCAQQRGRPNCGHSA